APGRCCSAAHTNPADAGSRMVRLLASASKRLRGRLHPTPAGSSEGESFQSGSDRGGVTVVSIHLVEGLVFDITDAWCQFETEECPGRHHHFRVAVSVGEAGLGIEFGVVFD